MLTWIFTWQNGLSRNTFHLQVKQVDLGQQFFSKETVWHNVAL